MNELHLTEKISKLDKLILESQEQLGRIQLRKYCLGCVDVDLPVEDRISEAEKLYEWLSK